MPPRPAPRFRGCRFRRRSRPGSAWRFKAASPVPRSVRRMTVVRRRGTCMAASGPVKIALLHSASAGDAVSPEILRRAVEGAGHRVVGAFEPNVETEAVLACSPEVVVAAGGDGMV